MRTEADTREELINPKLQEAGWGKIELSRIRREFYFTDGKIFPGGKRGKKKWADYVLEYKNKRHAIIEAKKENEEITEGLEQAKDYGRILGVDFVYSTNGRGIYEFRLSTGRGEMIDQFPTPEDLYNRIYVEKNDTREKLLDVPFEISSRKIPRYYQENAINNALDAISKEDDRILLTLATGTGKTLIAFQIVWKLFQARWNKSKYTRRPRVLYLADRNILVNQAKLDFEPLEKDCVKVNGEEIRKRGGKIPSNANVFFAIYQGIIGVSEKPYYLDYPEDFFDLVIIDECHRGGANDEGQWRQVLDYFSSATHLGLTATPKRDKNIDTYKYFGKPVYKYSLKEGISDGFLTPFKVKRVHGTWDEYYYTTDDEVLQGELEKEYYEKDDFDTGKIEIQEYIEAQVKIMLDNINQDEKTIIFCRNQATALFVRDLINKYKKSDNPNYCVRISANDGKIGEQFLDEFKDNDKTIPTIVTTSYKLSTGVDVRNVRNIVLMRRIHSMIEFKQIIGRGTRTFEGKDFFTIIDFVGVAKMFSDAEWDGEAEEEIEIDESKSGEGTEDIVKDPILDNIKEGGYGISEPESKKEKLRIKLSDGKTREIQNMVASMYFDSEGNLVSAQEFLKSLFGTLPEFFKDEDHLRKIWSNPKTRIAFLEKLENVGFDMDKLEALQKLVNAEDSDLFDVLQYVAYAKDMHTRKERVGNIETSFWNDLSEKEKEFLHFVLEQYTQNGFEELAEDRLSDLVVLKYGSPLAVEEVLGGVKKVRKGYLALQKILYNQFS